MALSVLEGSPPIAALNQFVSEKSSEAQPAADHFARFIV
jgi:hypothetical protein